VQAESPTDAAPSAPPAAEASATTPPAKPKRVRLHPYAGEASTPEELVRDPRQVAFFWVGLASAIAVLGLLAAWRWSPHIPGHDGATWWDGVTEVPLFAGLALLGFGFSSAAWAKRVTLAGWMLFGAYWSLVAFDLFYGEQADYVNFLFAIVGTYFFTYLAYHQWLSQVRRVESPTVHFLNISTFIAAGSYFVIDKIEPVRKWLILAVSDHTYGMLNLFGQGAKLGLVYHVDPSGSTSDTSDNLARFWYPKHLGTCPTPPTDLWGRILHFDPSGQKVQDCVAGAVPQSPHEILPVSIILACTALQSIMLFVGLFLGTPAPWRKRLVAGGVVAVVVYVLNLLRNTGIIWFYGQGQASFWIMHDAIGKGGSLVAMVLIAFAAFAWFPEFLTALIGVLDLPHRDGPLERALRIGRRRPEAATTPPDAPKP